MPKIDCYRVILDLLHSRAPEQPLGGTKQRPINRRFDHRRGLYGFLCRGEVAWPSWPCFFTDWKSVPPLEYKISYNPRHGLKYYVRT